MTRFSIVIFQKIYRKIEKYNNFCTGIQKHCKQNYSKHFQLHILLQLHVERSINDGFSFTGWTPIGITCIAFSMMMMLFPRMLPRAAARKVKEPEEKKEHVLTGKCKHTIQMIDLIRYIVQVWNVRMIN